MPPTSSQTTILFLAANPVDTDALRLSEELRDIKAALRLSEQRDRFVAQEKWAVRIDDLRRAMLEYEEAPLILHFAGHGEPGALYLEAADGRSKPVAAAALRDFLALFPNIQCIVLNACYSTTLADVLVAAAPCVVGMAANVADVHAIKFAVAFYDGIGAGRAPQRSFEIAAGSLKLEGGFDAVRPVFVQGIASNAGSAGNGGGSDEPDSPALVVPYLGAITGKQHGALADALAAAFGDVGALGQMVKRQLDRNLNAITGSSNIGTAAFELVDWAARSGYLRELIQGAVDTQPRNQQLRTFALSVGAQ